MAQVLPPKKEVALALLERSNVDVYLDPRAQGVVVPPQYRKEPRLILKIGLNMAVQIPDLRLDDESMSCTLSFSRTPFFCVVPWPSVFAMVGDDGRGMVWPDDVPQELAIREGRKPESVPTDEPSNAAPAATKGRGRARRATGDEEGKRPAAAAAPRGKKSKKKKEEAAPARPTLVAVPPVPPSTRDIGEARENRMKEGASPAAPRPVPAAQPRAQVPRRNGPKRELPPYLRVVK